MEDLMMFINVFGQLVFFMGMIPIVLGLIRYLARFFQDAFPDTSTHYHESEAQRLRQQIIVLTQKLDEFEKSKIKHHDDDVSYATFEELFEEERNETWTH
jgi:hypothetical protein